MSVTPLINVAPPPTTIPTPTAPTSTLPSDQQDAVATLQQTLDTYGLGSLAQWAWNEVVGGATADEVTEALRQTPQYNARFPGLNQMRQNGQGITEDQWVSYEQTARGYFQAAGLPNGFGTNNSDIAAYITSGISTDELKGRITDAQQAVYDNYDVAGASLYGMTPGDFTAMLLDPTQAAPLVQQKFNNAQAATVAQQTGFGALTAAQANEATANQPTLSDLTTKFSDAASKSQLYLALNQGETAISPDQVIGAEFQGNAVDQALINARQQGRLNVFAGGGSLAQGNSQDRGFTGAG